ncbi:MAG: ATP-binding protein [Oscillospiraceae bacterium]|nr:ATP-binding protein [Oscillospiraceae bacterium]MCL2279555.1 ATP-binding protein [Oscillospiraceae bacterium]
MAVNNLKIKAKLGVGFALLLSIIISIMVLGIINIGNVASDYAHTQNYSVVRYSLIRDLEVQLMDMRRIAATAAFVGGDVPTLEALDNEMYTLQGDMQASLFLFSDSLRGDEVIDSTLRDSLSQRVINLESLINAYLDDVVYQVRDAAYADDADEVFRLFLEAQTLSRELYVHFDGLFSSIRQDMYDRIEHNSRIAENTLIILGVFGVAGLLVGVIVAAHINNMINKSQDSLVYRQKMINAINQAAHMLLDSGDTDVMEAIAKGMEIVGRGANADQCTLWLNEQIAGKPHFVLKQVWVREPDEAIDIPVGKSFPFSDRPGWFELFSEGRRLNSPVAELPVENADFIAAYGAKSIVVQPLFINGKFFGTLSVADCKRERTFTKDEVDMFASAGLMFANALIRNDQKTVMENALEAERDAHELNQAIIDSAPFVIGLFGDDTNLFFANAQTKKFFNVDDPREIVDNLYDFSPEFQPCGTPSPEKAVMYAEKAYKEGYVRFEWMHQLKNGEQLPAECIYTRVQRKGKNMILCYTLDLREIKKAMMERQRSEAAEESNRAKSRFLARMSHEIRTPITAVLGISEIQLRSSALPEHMEEVFVKIYDSARTLLNLVNDILDLSRIESGKMPLVEQEYGVETLVNDAAEMHTVYLEHKDISFTMNADERLPALLIGDSLRIRQVINNLLNNALKYTEHGTVSLSLGFREEQSGYITLAITVEDTGYGMTEEQLDAIRTNEYTRFHEKKYRFTDGTGLGIPIVHSLVEMMGGQIDYESMVGKGTSVYVRIPQKTCGADVLGKEVAARINSLESGNRYAMEKFKFSPEPMPYGKVLVVDDVEANLFVAQGLLAFYELSVDSCNSGREAIEKIARGNVYDIVFMDYLMPELTGTEAMQMLRKSGYNRPIVALTANALVGQPEEFIAKGFDDFVSKPIQTPQLNDVLIKFIRNRYPPEVVAEAKTRSKGHHRAGEIDAFVSSVGVAEKLRREFMLSSKGFFADILQALETNDIKTAHRIAHTIKGSAGLIGEDSLAQIAKDLEASLSEGNKPTDADLSALGSELTRVLEKITVPEVVLQSSNFDKESAGELFDQLEPLLNSLDTRCMKSIAELEKIPQTAILVRQIEDYEFKLALASLRSLRKVLNV